MRILLLRHAEPDYDTDTLTEKGRREAELLGRRLSHYDIRDFYVSPLGRAQETASYTLREFGKSAETMPWLPEFRGRMAEAGKGLHEFDLPWDLMPRAWSSYPDAFDPEKWADIPPFKDSDIRNVWEETKAGMDELMGRYGFRKDGPVWLCERNTPDTIAIFSHFGIEMTVLAYLTDVSPMLLWHRTLCLPSSLTEVVTEEREPGAVFFRVTRMGDCAHLEANGEYRSMAGLFPECYNGIDSTDWKINGMEQWRKY